MIRQAIIAALLIGALGPPATAGVTIEGTRVIVDGSRQRTASIRVRNEGQAPAMVQIWVDAGDGSEASEIDNVPFRISPAGQRVLQVGAGQTFRVTYAPRPSEELPTDRESLLYFNLLDVPPAPDDAQQSTLQFAIRSRLKLFYRPAGIAGRPAEAAEMLEWTLRQEGNRQWLQIVNPSAFHITLASVLLPDEIELPASVIEPKGTLQVPINPATKRPTRLTFQWIDDYGTTREHQSEIAVLPAR